MKSSVITRAMATTAAVITIAGVTGIAAAPAKADAAGNSREQVIRDYQEILVPALSTPIGWTGDAGSCSAGDTSAEYQEATLTAVNYVRSLAGQPAVTMSAAAHGDAQAAAMIMAANNSLSHYPPADWACWTPQGATGAGRSNLTLGRTGPKAIVGYMADPGENNRLVGHRRWILSTQNREIATGDTSRSNALTVIGLAKGPSNDQWIPWPAAGYFPWQLEPNGRWSLGKPGADFSQATVTVTLAGQNIPVSPTVGPTGYGDPTISWDMQLPGSRTYDAHPRDTTVDVKVSGIRVNGAVTDYEYSVNLVDATAKTAPSTPSVDHVRRIKGKAMQIDVRGSSNDGGDADITYTVTATPQGTRKQLKGTAVRTCTAEGHSCIVDEVDPTLDYVVTVQAANAAGVSEISGEYLSPSLR